MTILYFSRSLSVPLACGSLLGDCVILYESHHQFPRFDTTHAALGDHHLGGLRHTLYSAGADENPVTRGAEFRGCTSGAV